MADSWKKSLKKQGFDSFAYMDVETDQTYRAVRDEFGLETIRWKTFKIGMYDIEQKTGLSKAFIQEYAPCLFIWDPLYEDIGAEKDFLFNVTNPNDAVDWIYANRQNLWKYKFLVTSQISNPNNGFVGNCVSNGKGRLFIETMHRPGVCNQRELSKPKKVFGEWLDFAAVEAFSLESIGGKFLTREDVHDIVQVYGGKKGFFEFVKGVHLGKEGYFTIGCEKGRFFCFPEEMHLDKLVNSRFRLFGRLASEKNECFARKIIGKNAYYNY